jgi:CRISPR-associated protein Cas2
MVVMILEKVPENLRGELSRWMLEVSTGVFVGSLSAMVRDLLWEKAVKRAVTGRCCQAYRTNNEQGFEIRMAGDSIRSTIDLDGLTLVTEQNARWRAWMEAQAEQDERALKWLAGNIEKPV